MAFTPGETLIILSHGPYGQHFEGVYTVLKQFTALKRYNQELTPQQYIAALLQENVLQHIPSTSILSLAGFSSELTKREDLLQELQVKKVVYVTLL